MDLFDSSGNSTGLQLKGNCKSISIKGDSDTEEVTSTDRDDYGVVLFSDTLPKPHTVDFVFDGFDVELFAAAFSGEASTSTQASGSTGASPIEIVANLDRFVAIGKRMVSAVVVKNSAGTTTYVEGTDYTVNARLGMIQALSTGSITDAATLQVSCSYAAINGSLISGATRTTLTARVLIDGKERSSGRDFIFDGKKVRLAATTEITLIGDKFAEVSFTGTFQKPDDGSAVYDLTFLS
jgi:hypothetical protein